MARLNCTYPKNDPLNSTELPAGTFCSNQRATTTRLSVCEMMRSNVEASCDRHPDRKACPDALLDYWPKSQRYGLLIHDGEGGYASSMTIISFCPWCGHKLPNGLDLSDDDD